jgi:hypothetical protein
MHRSQNPESSAAAKHPQADSGLEPANAIHKPTNQRPAPYRDTGNREHLSDGGHAQETATMTPLAAPTSEEVFKRGLQSTAH